MKRENLTRKYIFESFYSILKKKHYDSITVSDICARAGISRMSFYRNFESKENLLFRAIEEIAKIIRANINNLNEINQYFLIKSFFEAFQKYTSVISSFENSPVYNSLLSIANEQIKIKFEGDFINKTSKYIPIFYLSAIGATVLEWLKSGANETPDEMARLLCTLINDNKFDINSNQKLLFPTENKLGSKPQKYKNLKKIK